jgi:maltose O-acetyltransferase
VQNDGSDANGAERYFGAGVVGEDHALGTEEGAVADTDQRAKFLVDVQVIRKVDIPPDVHAAVPQTLESVSAPGGIKAPFQAREQRDRVQMRQHDAMLSNDDTFGNQPKMRRRLTTMILDWLAGIENRLAMTRARLKWARWQRLGMRIGRDVVLPLSTSVDSSYCYLITIGDRCHFGPQCLILAHDGQMDEFLDAGRVGRVVIGEGCRIGARCVILCNVEIGAGSIVEAGSVVATSLPPGSYCAGSPARVVSSVAEYAQRIAEEAAGRPRYTAETIAAGLRRPETRTALRDELAKGIILVDQADTAGLAPGDDRGLRPWPRGWPAQ